MQMCILVRVYRNVPSHLHWKTSKILNCLVKIPLSFSHPTIIWSISLCIFTIYRFKNNCMAILKELYQSFTWDEIILNLLANCIVFFPPLQNWTFNWNIFASYWHKPLKGIFQYHASKNNLFLSKCNRTFVIF